MATRGGAPKKFFFYENALSGSIHSTYQLPSLQTDQKPTLGQPNPHIPAFPHLFSAQINPFLAVLSTPHHSGRTTDKIQYKYKLQPAAAEKHITGNKSVVSVGRREKSPPFLATECGVNKC